MRTTAFAACTILCALAFGTGCTNTSSLTETTAKSTAALTSVTWTNAVGVTATGSDLTKTAGQGWNAGAASNETLAGDGYVEFTTAETNTNKAAGLSNGDTDQTLDDIDFAIDLTAGGTVRVYENGVWKGTFGSYVASDTFRVQTVGGRVTYAKNGTVFYTSATASTSPLLVDSALYNTNATIQNVGISATPLWQNQNEVSESSNSLTKSGPNNWLGGASTTATIPSDGYMEFTTGETNTTKVAGLSNGDTNQNYDDIDFAIYLTASDTVRVTENGVSRGTFGSYAAGDTFRVEAAGGVVTYSQNSTLFFTSSIAPTFPLLVDTALFTTGGTLQNVTLTKSPYWQNANGVTANGSDLTKPGPNGWSNAGASTVASISGDGYAEFTTGENTTTKVAGLSNGDSNVSYTDIDFGLYLNNSGMVRVFEAGNAVGTFGSYVAGDVFRVQTTGGVVTYLKNGNVIYTSSGTPTFPLLVDTALFNTGATLQSVTLHTGTGTSFWQNVFGVTANNNNLTKQGPNGWSNAGASTTATISGDGYVEFTTAENNTTKAAGLSNGDSNLSYTDIDFAIYLTASGIVRVFENGNAMGNFGTYTAGDVFRAQTTGGVVTYLKNGNVFYTSSGTPTFPLLADTGLFTTGATINGVTLQ